LNEGKLLLQPAIPIFLPLKNLWIATGGKASRIVRMNLKNEKWKF
jgi:hypothetical protein